MVKIISHPVIHCGHNDGVHNERPKWHSLCVFHPASSNGKLRSSHWNSWLNKRWYFRPMETACIRQFFRPPLTYNWVRSTTFFSFCLSFCQLLFSLFLFFISTFSIKTSNIYKNTANYTRLSSQVHVHKCISHRQKDGQYIKQFILSL